MSAERQKPSDHGRTLGREFANLADAMALLHPEVPERCKTCAFRHDTIPNQMAGTLVEAMHCVTGADRAVFGCHHTLGADGLPKKLCAGYILAKIAPKDDVIAALEQVVVTLAPSRADGPLVPARGDGEPDDGAVNITHTLRPFAVAMSGDGDYDPFKD